MAHATPAIPQLPRRRSSTSTFLRRIRRNTSIKVLEPAVLQAPPVPAFTVRMLEPVDDVRFGPSLVVAVNAELVGAEALELAADLEALGVAERSRIVLDLSDVYRIDGSGFVALTRLYGALLARGVSLHIREPQPVVRRRLLDSGLHLVVPVEGINA